MKKVLIFILLFIKQYNNCAAQDGYLRIANLSNCDARVEVYATDATYGSGSGTCGEYVSVQFTVPACTTFVWNNLCAFDAGIGWQGTFGALPCPAYSSTFSWTNIKVDLYNCGTSCAPLSYSDTDDPKYVCLGTLCTGWGCSSGWSCCGTPNLSSSWLTTTAPRRAAFTIF